MIPISHNWCIQIDITNYCFHKCLYCSRYNSHLRQDQREHMSLDMFKKILDSLKNWPARIGIIGGEPLMHPQFVEFCDEIKKRFPKQKMGLWSSGPTQYKKNIDKIQETFGMIAYNEHNEDQKNVCRHQPLTLAISEVVEDEEIMNKLIDDCWVQRTWCASANHKGGYFCEVAAAQDILLNDGANAWPIEGEWWNKTPEQFKEQRDKFCHNCGMAIPTERELIKKQSEKFTPNLLERFRSKGLDRLDDEHIELFTQKISIEELRENIKYWTPGNYREDIKQDEVAAEGRGYRGKL
jgi:organic radical activating enzyme